MSPFRVQNGRIPCARKVWDAIAIFETKPLYEKRLFWTLENTILRPPVCLLCRLVASVADEGRGNTHTQDNYSNPRCACAPRVITSTRVELTQRYFLSFDVGIYAPGYCVMRQRDVPRMYKRPSSQWNSHS